MVNNDYSSAVSIALLWHYNTATTPPCINHNTTNVTKLHAVAMDFFGSSCNFLCNGIDWIVTYCDSN